MKFDSSVNEAPSAETPKGCAPLPDPVIASLIANARRDGFSDQFGLVAYLTNVYGGDLIQNALGAKEMELSDSGRDEIKRRVGHIDIPHTAEESGAAHGLMCPTWLIQRLGLRRFRPTVTLRRWMRSLRTSLTSLGP